MSYRLLCALALSVIALGGCTETKKEWRKDGVPKDVVKRQKALCDYKAELDAGSPADFRAMPRNRARVRWPSFRRCA